MALIGLAWLLSQLVRLALSRSRELLADAGSVELTKNPDAMISALRKIENRGELPGATSAVMELCLDNPREGFSDLFATHPSVESRVQALVKFAGGHDPGPLALPPDTGSGDRPQPPTDGQIPPPVPSGPWSDAAASRRHVAGHLTGSLGQSCRPVGPALTAVVQGNKIAAVDRRRLKRAPRVNDIGRINLNRRLNELNSPLFLPCSRPKQAWGYSGRASLLTIGIPRA